MKVFIPSAFFVIMMILNWSGVPLIWSALIALVIDIGISTVRTIKENPSKISKLPSDYYIPTVEDMDRKIFLWKLNHGIARHEGMYIHGEITEKDKRYMPR